MDNSTNAAYKLIISIKKKKSLEGDSGGRDFFAKQINKIIDVLELLILEDFEGNMDTSAAHDGKSRLDWSPLIRPISLLRPSR